MSRAASGTRPWKSVWELLANRRGGVAQVGVSSFVGALSEAGFLVSISRLGLAVAAGRDRLNLVGTLSLSLGVCSVVAAALLLVRLAAYLSSSWLAANLSASVSASLRARLSRAYLYATWEVQQRDAAGRLQQLATSFTTQASAVLTAATTSLSAALGLLALLGAAVIVDPLSTAIAAASLFLLGSVLGPVRNAIRRRARAASTASLEVAQVISELSDMALEMQVFGVREEFHGVVISAANSESRLRRQADLLRAMLPHLYSTLAFGALLAGVSAATGFGESKIGALGTVTLVMLRALTYGQQLQSSSGALMSAIPALEQIESAIHDYETAAAITGEIKPPSLLPLTVDAASFGYKASSPLIENLSFSVARGEIVGIVGQSGAGKTTLIQLIMGVRAPKSGKVLAGGSPVAELNPEFRTSRLAFVPQDAHLLSTSVRDNIQFFRLGIRDEDIRLALRHAFILAEIEALDGGLDAVLHAQGAWLSGGQRQRLALARALAGNPELLVLDEPTAALDEDSEAAICASLQSLGPNRAVVLVTHRPALLRICTKVISLGG